MAAGSSSLRFISTSVHKSRHISPAAAVCSASQVVVPPGGHFVSHQQPLQRRTRPFLLLLLLLPPLWFPNHSFPEAQSLQSRRLIGVKNGVLLPGGTDSEQFVLSFAQSGTEDVEDGGQEVTAEPPPPRRTG